MCVCVCYIKFPNWVYIGHSGGVSSTAAKLRGVRHFAGTDERRHFVATDTRIIIVSLYLTYVHRSCGGLTDR